MSLTAAGLSSAYKSWSESNIFFSVPQVHFVLGVHLGQLRNSVKAAYGAEIDAHSYLQKFIQITLPLFDDEEVWGERVAARYVGYLSKVLELPSKEELDIACELVRYVAEKRNLSLRVMERIMTTMAVALAHKEISMKIKLAATRAAGLVVKPCPGAILGGLSILKITNPELYLKAKSGSLTLKDVGEALGFFDPVDFKHDSPKITLAMQYWHFCTGD